MQVTVVTYPVGNCQHVNRQDRVRGIVLVQAEGRQMFMYHQSFTKLQKILSFKESEEQKIGQHF